MGLRATLAQSDISTKLTIVAKAFSASDFIGQVDRLIAVRHGREPERDEGDRKPYGSTGVHFRVTGLR